MATDGNMRFDVACSSDIGGRNANADAVLASPSAGIFAVADGMGDTPRAAAAARMALEAVHELFADSWSGSPLANRRVSEAAERLTFGVMQANGRLFVERRAEERCLGTTFAGAVACGDHLCIGAVGDSRLYLFRPSAARLNMLTEDNTVLNDAVWRGVPYDVAAAQPRAHALTRAIGIWRAIDIRPAMAPWAPGDVLLACTDGVSDRLNPGAIKRTLVHSATLQEAADRLVERALAAGGRDNTTAVLARWLP